MLNGVVRFVFYSNGKPSAPKTVDSTDEAEQDKTNMWVHIYSSQR
jgi:hypothetical protein